MQAIKFPLILICLLILVVGVGFMRASGENARLNAAHITGPVPVATVDLRPEIAIKAMQAVNAAVRNPVFTIAFFGTPPLLVLTTILLFWSSKRPAALLLTLACLIYISGVLIVTVIVNVPMNQALSGLVPGQDGPPLASGRSIPHLGNMPT